MGKAIGLSILAVLAVVALAVGGFWLKVVLSDPVGQGNAIINKNDAVNRVNKQELFEDMYSDIKATDRKLDALKAAAVDKTGKQNYASTVAYCFDVVGDYNAEARKFSAESFRSIDLPYQIDEFDPATDCKENS